MPFCYSGSDCYYTLEFAKNIQETGSVDVNPRVAAPLGHEYWRDPQLLALTILPMRFLFLFFGDFGSVVNLYFLLGFPLTALTALYALRALGFSYFAAVVPALLYAFLPFHLWRGEDGLLLIYFLVPLVSLTAFWISGGTLLFKWSAGKRWPELTGAGIASVIFCILIGSDYPYYAFFGILLFLLATAYAWFAFRDRQAPLAAAAMIAITVFTYALNIAGYLLARGGDLPSGELRLPREAEFYGMKIIQLLLPIQSHRIGALAHFRSYYDATAPLVNENGTTSLGVVGALGFLLLLGVVLFPLRQRLGDVLQRSAILNLGCVLFATVSGFATLFNYLVSPDIRSYNRIVVVIAFFSFVAVAWSLETVRERFLRSANARRLGVAGLALMLCLGLADQTSPAMIPTYALNAAAYRSDSEFVRKIESSLPTGAAVFELPYVPFRDSAELLPAGVSPYWMFKGYLHSNSLRWTYGAQKGTEDDAWLRSLSALPAERLLQELVLADFNGIFIARNAYTEPGDDRRLESDLRRILNERPLTAEDGVLAFYSLTNFRQREIARLSESGFATAGATLPPLLMRISGCYPTERSVRHVPRRWCNRHAVITITNLTSAPKKGILSGVIADDTVEGTIDVKLGGQSSRLSVSPKGESTQMTLTVPPGTSLIEFDANLPGRPAPAGPSYFFLRDFRLRDTTTGDTTDFYNY